MAAFISKFPNFEISIGGNFIKFERGRLDISDENIAAGLRNAKSFGVDFWEETTTGRKSKASDQ